MFCYQVCVYASFVSAQVVNRHLQAAELIGVSYELRGNIDLRIRNKGHWLNLPVPLIIRLQTEPTGYGYALTSVDPLPAP